VPDPSGELQKLLGVSVQELWLVGFMIYTYHFSVTALDGRKCVFDPGVFVLEGSRKQEMEALIRRVLDTICLTPEQYRERYAADGSKYREPSGREGYWISEFSILRDFPVVSLGDGRYCAPYPTYALTRVLDGFYYDLLNEFARRKIASGAKDNPYDNVNRALKYAVMFVGLVFLSFFVFEALSGQRLHPAQYLMIGLAQMVFYLLLLSLAEYVGFDWGFLAAGGATVLLIGIYAGAVFKSRAYGARALVVFTLVYALSYLLMRLEDFALLAGSLASFIGLAAAMYLTRNIDWYGKRPPAPAAPPAV